MQSSWSNCMNKFPQSIQWTPLYEHCVNTVNKRHISNATYCIEYMKYFRSFQIMVTWILRLERNDETFHLINKKRFFQHPEYNCWILEDTLGSIIITLFHIDDYPSPNPHGFQQRPKSHDLLLIRGAANSPSPISPKKSRIPRHQKVSRKFR